MNKSQPPRVTSALLETTNSVQHGFFGRVGGVSKSVWSSLNTGEAVGDDPADVAANRTRIAQAFGLDGDRLCTVLQVHGAKVVDLDGPIPADQLAADALLTTRRDLVLGIKTADCVPMLVIAPGIAVAAVHGGWRSLVAGICEATVGALVQLGAQTQKIKVALGPHIGPCCYEVGEDVVLALGEIARVDRGPSLPHADLAAAAKHRWIGAGVHASGIDVVGGCVRCQPQAYFSHRGGNGRTGRNMAVIMLASSDT